MAMQFAIAAPSEPAERNVTQRREGAKESESRWFNSLRLCAFACVLSLVHNLPVIFAHPAQFADKE
jgi:hypothetical protein